MTKLVCTIWALLLNTVGVSIFQTCFANSMEDDDGEILLSGPPITSFLFASGVYTILMKSSFIPSSFRKPHSAALCLYEFLATAFFLEFAMACVWTPIDVLVHSTLPKMLCQLFTHLGKGDTGNWIMTNKYPMSMLSCAIALTFFFLTLHVTKAVDFSTFQHCGFMEFANETQNNMRQQLMSELSKSTNKSKKGHSKKNRRRRRSRSRSKNNDSM